MRPEDSSDQAVKETTLQNSKRRRATAEDGDAPAPKKTYSEAEIAAQLANSLQLREQRRAEVRTVYLNYGMLLKGSENGAEALAFQGLLDCANGSLGARRLAARLVPRFLPRFPFHLEQAYRLLIALYTGDTGRADGRTSSPPPTGHASSPRDRRHDADRLPNGNDTAAVNRPVSCGAAGFGSANVAAPHGGEAAAGSEAALLHALRRDALLGLGNVLETAVRQAERGVPLVAEMVGFLLRQLSHSGAVAHDTIAPKRWGAAACDAPPHPAAPTKAQDRHRHPDCNGGAVGSPSAATAAVPSAASQPGAALLEPDPDSDAGVMHSLLLRAFCLFPRVVLAACLQPHRLSPPQRTAEDCQAGEALLATLLREAPQPSSAADSVGEVRQGQGAANGCTASASPPLPACATAPTASAAAARVGGGGYCLAETVLSALPDTQAWLRQLGAAVAQGKAASSLSPAVRAHLSRLLQFCTAAQPPSTTGPHAGAVKTSPLASPGGGSGAAASATPDRCAAGPAPPPPPPPARAPEVKVEPGLAPPVAPAHSLLGSEDNSRSVPMDLDHSISTAIKQEPGAAAAQGGAGGATDTAATGPADTAATSPPLPPPPPPPMHAAPPASPPVVSGSAGLLRGGSVCRAEACLYVSGLPPGMGEAAVVAELSRLGSVESVHPAGPLPHPAAPPPLHHGASMASASGGLGEDAYVVFASLRDAAVCYEAIARTCPFGGTRPLHVEFCSVFPPDSPAARRRAAAAAAGGGGAAAASLASQFIWVSSSSALTSGPASAAAPAPTATPEAVVAALQEASLPVPQQILQVQGRAPGMLLHMASAAVVPQVAACLQARFAPLPPPPPPLPPPPPTTVAMMGAPAPSPAAVTASPAAAAPPQPPPLPPPPPHGGHYGTPAASAGGKGSARDQYDAPPPNCRTIWVGQLHESVREEELLSACRAAGGPLVGHRFLRGSHCAFVDFATQAGAEAAKRALHGLRMGPQHLRVEWKDSGMRGGGRHSNMMGAGVGIGDSGPSPHGHVPAALGQTPSAAGRGGVGTPGQPPGSASGLGTRGSHGGGQRAGADRWAPVAVPPLPPAPVTSSGAGVAAGGTPLPPPPAGQQQTAAMLRMGYPADMSPAVAAAVRQAPLLLPPQHPGAPSAYPSHPHLQAHSLGGMTGSVHMPSLPHPGLQTPQQPLGYGSTPTLPMQHMAGHQTPSAGGSGPAPHHTPHPLSQAPPGPQGQLTPSLSLQRFDSGPAAAVLAAAGSQPHSTSSPRPPDGVAGTMAVALSHARSQHAPQAALSMWQGSLAKSGSHMCTLRCTSGGASAAGGATPGEREPVGWPAVLDVKLRVDLTYVVHSLYSHTAPHVRAMRRLVPCGASGGPPDPVAPPKLSEFLSYLTEKNRAGVIKLDASPAASLPPRTLYLVPPSEQVCAALGAEWTPSEPFLLALVVPTAGGG